MRHVPDISCSASRAYDLSDSTFQIPAGANDSTELLMAQDGGDFFQGVDQTLTTPAIPKFQRMAPPLTLPEQTPNPNHERPASVRYFLRPRPRIATPRRPTVTKDLAAALSEGMPGTGSDTSFEIPLSQTNSNDLITADNGRGFLGPGEADFSVDTLSPMTNTQLLSKVESQPACPSMPPLLHTVGNEATVGHSSPSRKNPKPRPKLATEDHQFSAAIDDTQPTAQRLEASNASSQKENAAEPSAPLAQEQPTVPKTSRTKAQRKRSAATSSQNGVPGVKAKRVSNSISCVNLYPHRLTVYGIHCFSRLSLTVEPRIPGRQNCRRLTMLMSC